ncbi:hypothetical protein HBB16_05565 [Pseudonocardia sp. MCCB 268]|nr:hypothetical protein [Pseudonocardia cytotoxica]
MTAMSGLASAGCSADRSSSRCSSPGFGLGRLLYDAVLGQGPGDPGRAARGHRGGRALAGILAELVAFRPDPVARGEAR